LAITGRISETTLKAAIVWRIIDHPMADLDSFSANIVISAIVFSKKKKQIIKTSPFVKGRLSTTFKLLL
jgi:hypothetical protein